MPAGSVGGAYASPRFSDARRAVRRGLVASDRNDKRGRFGTGGWLLSTYDLEVGC